MFSLCSQRRGYCLSELTFLCVVTRLPSLSWNFIWTVSFLLDIFHCFSDSFLTAFWKNVKKTFLIKQSINNWILVTFHTNFSYATGPWVKCYWHLWQPEKKSWTRLMNDILIHTCGRLRLANDKLILDSQSEILLCPLNREMCLSQKPKDNIYKRQNQ